MNKKKKVGSQPVGAQPTNCDSVGSQPVGAQPTNCDPALGAYHSIPPGILCPPLVLPH